MEPEDVSSDWQTVMGLFVNHHQGSDQVDLKKHDFVKQLNKVINNFLFLERKRIFSFQGIDLYPSEIHLLLVIDEKQNTNATRMAERLGITKGAISQVLTRLQKKGVITKTKDPYSKNEITVSFTDVGAKAIKEFKKVKYQSDKQYNAYLATLNEHELEVLKRFLTYLEGITSKL